METFFIGIGVVAYVTIVLHLIAHIYDDMRNKHE